MLSNQFRKFHTLNKEISKEYKRRMTATTTLQGEMKKIRIKEIRKWLKGKKNECWFKMLETNTKNSQFFKLTKNLLRKGKIDFTDDKLAEMKQKNPVIDRSLN